MIDIEKPFKLENITVHPKTDELSYCGKTIAIKSMAMKVICYFAKNKDIVISRDCLRNDLWQNPTTSNHTINNHIYSLRQSLAQLDDQTKFFHTVTGTKNGYRLLADVTQETIQPISSSTGLNASKLSDESAHNKNKLNKTKLRSLILPSFLIVTCIIIFLSQETKFYNHATALTSHAGQEQNPAISLDGDIIIYANRTRRPFTWELYASKVQTPLQPTKVFSSMVNHDNFVSISPNKKYIAFIRYAKGAEGIYIANFNADSLTAHNEKLTIPLSAVNSTPAISWLNNSQFFYTAKKTALAPLKIYLYDLATNRSEQVTSPPINTVGDFAVVVSPDRNWLAIMRADNLHGYQLYLYHLSTKTLMKTQVTNTEQRLNISFSDDSLKVYFVDQQGFLSSYDIKKKVITKISAQQHMGYWPLKIPGKEQFIMQEDWGLSPLTAQIIKTNNPRVGGDGASEVVVNNGLSIAAVEGIANGGLIFASVKPNQQIEIWKYQHGKVFKLNEFHETIEYREPLNLHWSKNTNTALLSINKSCRIIDIDSGKDTPLCPDNENIYAGRFSYDGQSIFLASFDNSNAIEIGVSGYPVNNIPELGSVNSIHQNSDGSFYYSKEPSFDIYHFNPTTGENTLIVKRTFVYHRYSGNDFVVTAQGIYYMDRIAVTKNSIYYYDFSSKKSEYIIDSKGNYPSLVISEDERFIYLIESTNHDSKLLLIE
ncbi:winged helix-turn-helix domain-containing protein [Pseudoalteromonas sp. MMG013]|uniref:winged helix-turn-helix domain-containing protein n=1 Tax=Pseudoalteromonas sp. MMG013 TaxID=2822687 RepID=UPI001B36D401|nr:winged helix-turn-helix domain-containing protein [Pseudoalteromonas sp. MMG013]MBQ4860079.1 winged helix-turn-helix domain-containing protein [Pseudoalteromonas sp. MMG013]